MKYSSLIYSVDPANDACINWENQILVQLINDAALPCNVSNMVFVPNDGASLLEVMYEACSVVHNLINNNHRWNCYNKVYVGIRWKFMAYAPDPVNGKDPVPVTYKIDTIRNDRVDAYCNYVVTRTDTDDNVEATDIFDRLAEQVIKNVWFSIANSNIFLSKNVFIKADADEDINQIVFNPTEKNRDLFPIPGFEDVHLCWDEDFDCPAIHFSAYNKKSMATDVFRYQMVIANEISNTTLSSSEGDEKVVDTWMNLFCMCLMSTFKQG